MALPSSWSLFLHESSKSYIPRRSFRQKFLLFSGRAALPVLGRKSTFCRGNVFVAANFPFQESSQTRIIYSRGVEYHHIIYVSAFEGSLCGMSTYGVKPVQS